MKKLINSALLLFVMIISSCGTYVYKSVSPKTNLFEKRNDFAGQLNIGGGGAEAYAAFAPINYLGGSLSLAGATTSSDSTNSNTARKFRDFEVSLIPFYPYQVARFECPIGLGFTKTKSPNNSFAAFSPYTRAFIQPTVGFHWTYFEMAVFMRYSKVAYTNIKWGTDTRFEPGLMFRGGSENIKGMLQLRLDYGTNYSQTPAAALLPDQQVLYIPLHISIGVNFNINFSKEKKATSDVK